MKYRDGFVSNSSSSSFTILLKDISGLQVGLLLNHQQEAKKYGMYCDKKDEWSVYIEDYIIRGYTDLDNFDMEEYMENIDIDMSKVRW